MRKQKVHSKFHSSRSHTEVTFSRLAWHGCSTP